MMFLILLSLHLGFLKSQPSAWTAEIQDSVQRNVRGQCKWNIANSVDSPTENDKFTVTYHLPSQEEIETFANIPHTLTKIIVNTSHEHVKMKLDSYAGKKGSWANIAEHPSQDKPRCVNVTRFTAKIGTIDLYQDYKMVKRTAYLLRSKNAFIHPYGYVGISCGYFQGREGCETRFSHKSDKWWQQCKEYFEKSKTSWLSLWDNNQNMKEVKGEEEEESFRTACGTKTGIPEFHNRVFVATGLWDDNFAHFILDSLSRIARHLDFLLKNPDIKIHIRAFKDDPRHVAAGVKMRLRLFSMLGISPERIVHGPVLAGEVFVPRAMTCGYSLFNPLEVRLIAKKILEGAKKQAAEFWNSKGLDPLTGKDKTQTKNEKTKYLIIQQRDKNAKNPGRGWNNETAQSVVDAFRKRFPNHEVLRLSSITQAARDYCAACEIVQYSQAEILVGMHGAGLINMIFMPIGGLVIEISNSYSGLNFPYCGYIGPQSSISGHDHFVFSYERFASERFKPEAIAKTAREYYEEVKLNRKSVYPVYRNGEILNI